MSLCWHNFPYVIPFVNRMVTIIVIYRHKEAFNWIIDGKLVIMMNSVHTLPLCHHGMVYVIHVIGTKKLKCNNWHHLSRMYRRILTLKLNIFGKFSRNAVFPLSGIFTLKSLGMQFSYAGCAKIPSERNKTLFTTNILNANIIR